jgi:aspartyl-tRNA(Asn)/glutamyl-tRNA(Gln) amidotransferase subunit C
MSINKETVKHIAHLSRIELQDNELDKISAQLHDILGFIDKISTLDIKNAVAASHILPISNVLREDTPRISLAYDKVLENAPSKKGNFFTVPKIIE